VRCIVPSRTPGGALITGCSFLKPSVPRSHSSRLACHPGARGTLVFVLQCFWWPGVRDVSAFVAVCTVCLQKKTPWQAPAGSLQPLPVPHCSWSHISLDFVTGLPPSDGNTVFLNVVDRFSAHFILLPKLPSAKETAQLMVQHIFRIHGLSMNMVSDWILSSRPSSVRRSAT
jgi:hypothetical protein